MSHKLPTLIALSLALLALSLLGCRDITPEGLGAAGEECLSDLDCRDGLICEAPGVCTEGESWPLATDPATLAFPEGVYRAIRITANNSNAATRKLAPFMTATTSAAETGMFLVLELGVDGKPFELNVGSARGTAPLDLDFFEDRLRPRPLDGAFFESEPGFAIFDIVETPPRQEPQNGFYIVLEGPGFFIPVPISAVSASGFIDEGGTGLPDTMNIVFEAYILRRLAREVTVEVEGQSSTLDDFLDPVTQDLDIDRDSLLDGWTILLEIQADRAVFP